MQVHAGKATQSSMNATLRAAKMSGQKEPAKGVEERQAGCKKSRVEKKKTPRMSVTCAGLCCPRTPPLDTTLRAGTLDLENGRYCSENCGRWMSGRVALAWKSRNRVPAHTWRVGKDRLVRPSREPLVRR